MNRHKSTCERLPEAAPILLPPPKRLRMLGGAHSGTRARTRTADIGRSENGAYRLSISPDRILVEAADAAGIFYGRKTLEQIRGQYSGALPCLEIEDWPDFPVRGFYHDVTRGKVPKLRTLMELADTCSRYKINQLQLYIEHTYAFRRHREVWAGSDPLTADEIRALDAHCAKLHIDLVPSFSTFGHLYGWIRTKKFRHLNELERDAMAVPFNWWDRQLHYTLDCRNPGALALVREIIAEVRPLFRSKLFNICCDETFDLGKGKNRKLAAKLGTGRLYVDFLKQIMRAVREAGATPMFWGDVIGHHPELIAEIPADAIALDWDYGAGLKDSKAGLMRKSGRTFYVCPGVAGWARWMNDYRTAHRNITRYARLGKSCGAAGLLNTDWGDYGHINALGLSIPGLIVGASAAWNCRSPQLAESRIEAAISHLELGEASGKLLGLMREAVSSTCANWQSIALWVQPRSRDIPDDWFDAASGLPSAMLAQPVRKHAAALKTLLMLTRKIERTLRTATPQDLVVADEIRTALLGMRVLEEICLVLRSKEIRRNRRLAPRLVARRIRELEAALHRDWNRRNKPSEYDEVRKVLLGAAEALDRTLTGCP